MNKLAIMAGAALAAMAISSCDDDTLTIGSSLTNTGDKLIITPATYTATTQTIMADSVLSLASSCYLGKVFDPETGTVISSDFSTQFNVLEYLHVYPDENIEKDANGDIVADSCDLILFLSSPYKSDDSLTAMKLRVSELERPIEKSLLPEGSQHYYSNFDPTPYLRSKEQGGIDLAHMFTFQNRTDDDEVRDAYGYLDNIHVVLNQPYTARDGVTYKDYGTYLLRQHSAHPEYFANSYVFAKNVCPGFFFQITDGMGFHSQVSNIGLRVYYNVTVADSTYRTNIAFAGTKEVLQTIRVRNDKASLAQLAGQRNHTYLKSPAGLFTEVTLPVSEIKNGHETDSLLAASITFQRMNNLSEDTRTLDVPQTILMIPKDSIYTFFEHNQLPDSQTSYITSFNSGTNTYSFSNISNIINRLWSLRQQGLASDEWNKVVLIPVNYAVSSSTSSITKVEHDLSLSSTRLVGGDASAVSIAVKYAKFQQ